MVAPFFYDIRPRSRGFTRKSREARTISQFCPYQMKGHRAWPRLPLQTSGGWVLARRAVQFVER